MAVTSTASLLNRDMETALDDYIHGGLRLYLMECADAEDVSISLWAPRWDPVAAPEMLITLSFMVDDQIYCDGASWMVEHPAPQTGDLMRMIEVSCRQLMFALNRAARRRWRAGLHPGRVRDDFRTSHEWRMWLSHQTP